MDVIKMVTFGSARILEEQIAKNKEHIMDYCKQEGIDLVQTRVTFERGFFEPLYFFSDDLGGYTIDAVKESLRG